MSTKPSKFLRDKSGRVFLNCKQLASSGRGFEPVPEPPEFAEVGTVAGVSVGSEGQITSETHPNNPHHSQVAPPAVDQAPEDPPLTPTPDASPGAQLYQAEATTPADQEAESAVAEGEQSDDPAADWD